MHLALVLLCDCIVPGPAHALFLSEQWLCWVGVIVYVVEAAIAYVDRMAAPSGHVIQCPEFCKFACAVACLRLIVITGSGRMRGRGRRSWSLSSSSTWGRTSSRSAWCV